VKIFALFLICFCLQATAKDFSGGPILDGATLQPVKLEDIIKSIQPGTAIVLSEIHTVQSHHDNQLNFAYLLQESQKLINSQVHIGFEMFDITEQNLLDDYSDKFITAEQLKSYVSLNKDWFQYYLPLLNFTRQPDVQAIGLNAPKWLTSKIARVGVEQLSHYEELLIPPDFEVGDNYYFERFKQISHIPSDRIYQYFQAQSMWDDVMADTSKEFLAANPQSVLLIIVGDFHAAYYGGLPKRLKKRGITNVLTISQVSVAGLNEKEKAELLTPHVQYGQRADYIWISEEAEK